MMLISLTIGDKLNRVMKVLIEVHSSDYSLTIFNCQTKWLASRLKLEMLRSTFLGQITDHQNHDLPIADHYRSQNGRGMGIGKPPQNVNDVSYTILKCACKCSVNLTLPSLQ